jgi:NAD(P)H-dependent FMN reductase
MIVACPEYNGLITPYLKNTIDWVSRLQYIDESCSNAFIDKPVLLVSASTGWSGGAVGLPSARTLFGYIGCHVLGGAISIPNIQQYLIGSELNFDQNYENLIAFHLQRFKELLAPKTLVNTGFLKG